MLRFAPLLLVLLVLTACGSEENRVRSSVERYLDAAQEQDFARMCKHLLWNGDGDCETSLARRAMAKRLEDAGTPRVVTVRVMGKAAVVLLDSPGPLAEDSLSLVEIGKHWKIEAKA